VTKVLVVPFEQADTLVAMHGSAALCTFGPAHRGAVRSQRRRGVPDNFVDNVVCLVSGLLSRGLQAPTSVS